MIDGRPEGLHYESEPPAVAPLSTRCRHLDQPQAAVHLLRRGERIDGVRMQARRGGAEHGENQNEAAERRGTHGSRRRNPQAGCFGWRNH